MIQSVPVLTQGAIFSMMIKKEKPANPILQIIQIREISRQRKHRVALSDGVHFTSALFSQQLNPRIDSGDITTFTIISLEEYIVAPTNDKDLLILISLEPVCNLNMIIGNPENILSLSSQNSQNMSQIQQTSQDSITPALSQVKTEFLNPNNISPQPPNISPQSHNLTFLSSLQNNSQHSQQQHQLQPQPSSTQPNSNNSRNINNENNSNENNTNENNANENNTHPNHHDLPIQSRTVTVEQTTTVQQHLPTFFNATQNTARRQRFIDIDVLNPYIPNWTMLARVVMKSSVLHYSSKFGRSGKLFNVILKDKRGSEIKGTFFAEQVDIFEPLIETDKVYQISGGMLSDRNHKFNSTVHDYEITFNSTTKFVPMPDDQTIGKLTYRFVRLVDLPLHPPRTSVDILCYVISVGEIQQIHVKDRMTDKRDVVICDASNVKCDMTLWDTDARSFDLTNLNCIVAFKDAKLSDFKGRTLSSPSIITIRPNNQFFSEINELQVWLNTINQNDFDKLETVSKGGEFNSNFIFLSQINEQGLGSHEKPDYGTVYLTLQEIINKRKLYYPACPNPECKFKGLTQNNDSFLCEKCQKIVENPAYRFNFSVKVADFTGSTFMNILGDDQIGALIIGKTAKEWQQDTELLEESEIRKLLLPCFFKLLKLKCRIKTDNFNGQSAVKMNIYSAQPLDFAEGAMFFANEINKFS